MSTEENIWKERGIGFDEACGNRKYTWKTVILYAQISMKLIKLKPATGLLVLVQNFAVEILYLKTICVSDSMKPLLAHKSWVFWA